MATNSIYRSLLHIQIEKLNKLFAKPWSSEFIEECQKAVDCIDSLGYRLLSIHSISSEDLLFVPSADKVLLAEVKSLLFDLHNLTFEDTEDTKFKLLARLRPLENEIISHYASDDRQTRFQLFSHQARLVVYREMEHHPVNQFIETHRIHSLSKIRMEYLQMLKTCYRDSGGYCKEDILYGKKAPFTPVLLVNTHMQFISAVRRSAPKTLLFENLNPLFQLLNTHLLAALENMNGDAFMNYGFWNMCDHLKHFISENAEK